MLVFVIWSTLIVGDGGGRQGATDGRTAEIPPSYMLIKVGMKDEEVERLVGKSAGGFNLRNGAGILESVNIYHSGPDLVGNHVKIKIWSEDYRVTKVVIEPWTGRLPHRDRE
jgi:hypothetical protein